MTRHRNQRRYGHQFRLTRRGIWFWLITLIVGASAIFSSNNQLFLMAAFLAGVFVGTGVLTGLMLRGMEVRRRLPPAGYARELWTCELQISPTTHSRLGTRCYLGLVDPASERGDPQAPIEVPPLPRGQSWEMTGRLLPARRGWLTLEPPRLTCRLPFGLLEIRRSRIPPDRILVYPQRRQFTRAFYAHPLAREMGLSESVAARGIDNEEFAGLREYRQGDNPRHIHWKMSARLRDHLLLRQYERSGDRQIAILLDTSRGTSSPTAGDEVLEDNIVFAMALTEALLLQGLPVKFFSFVPQTFQLELHPGQVSHWEGLHRTLALLQPSGTDSLAGLLDCARAISSSWCVVILLRPLPAGLPRLPPHCRLVAPEEARQFVQNENAAGVPPSSASPWHEPSVFQN